MFGKANNLTSKKHYVTETQTTNISNHVLGDDGDSSPEETMTPSSQSREDAAEPTSNSGTIRGMEFATHYEFCGLRESLWQRRQKHSLEVNEALRNSRKDGQPSEVPV